MDPKIRPAYLSLRQNQRQLDADGCEVGVSRQALDEVLDAFLISTASIDWPDALDCFWNAAIGAAHQRQDSTAFSLADVMTQGISAVSQRIREQKEAALPESTMLMNLLTDVGRIVVDVKQADDEIVARIPFDITAGQVRAARAAMAGLPYPGVI